MTANPRCSRWQEAAVGRLLALLRQKHSLDLGAYETRFLIQSIEKRCQETRSGTPQAYLARLAQDPAEAGRLERSLRIAYSDFFRDPVSFALLEQVVLPGLIAARAGQRPAELRIWSAGCAAGQEAWSLAILIDELLDRRGRPATYRIFATDLSASDLETARNAIYPPQALDNLRQRHLRACFEPHDEAYRVQARLRQRVDFSRYDLLEEATTCPPVSIYGDFDLVICSNVLLYYRAAVRDRLVNKLQSCLAPGGYLMTGEAEGPIVAHAGGFHPVVPSVVLFRKTA